MPFSIHICFQHQATQINPFPTQMCFGNFKLFNGSHLQLKCAFPTSNHSNQVFSNSHVFLHPQVTQIPLTPSNMYNRTHRPQIMSSSPRMTLILSNVYKLHSIPSNHDLLNSNDVNMVKCAQHALNILNSCFLTLKWTQYPQMCTFALHNLKLDPLTLKWPSIH